MDAQLLSELRMQGRYGEILSGLPEFMDASLQAKNLEALAGCVRSLLDTEGMLAASCWLNLRPFAGFVSTCGAGTAWKLAQFDPSRITWDPSIWPSLPSWIPSGNRIVPAAEHAKVIGVREAGFDELIGFQFLLDCPWCDHRHVFPIQRTMIYFRKYSCPGCEGPLQVDGRKLRLAFDDCRDNVALEKLETRIHRLNHDLQRAEGTYPPEAQLLCVALPAHLTRIASAALVSKGGEA